MQLGLLDDSKLIQKESHLQDVKIIFKFLQGTQDFGLWYPNNVDLTLHAYTDANWARNVDD